VCNAPPEQAALSAVYEGQRRNVVAAENGQVLLVSLFLLTIAVNLMLFGMLRSRGMDSRSTVTLLRLAIEIGMMFAVYYGGETIRLFWVLSAALGLLVTFPLVFSVAWLPMSGILLFQIYSIYILRFSPAVSAFLQQQDSKNGN
jgi:ABC-type protease/lipase transport system fused ATPase/permease subunit